MDDLNNFRDFVSGVCIISAEDRTFTYGVQVKQVKTLIQRRNTCSKATICNVSGTSLEIVMVPFLLILNSHLSNTRTLVFTFHNNDHKHKGTSQVIFTCSKSTKKTLRKGVKYVQN